MVALDFGDLRRAAAALAEPLHAYERAIKGNSLDALARAREELISRARCVLLAESSLRGIEELVAADEAEKDARAKEDAHTDLLVHDELLGAP